MLQKRIALFLIDGGNEFQRQLRADADAAAAAEGLAIETCFTGPDYAGQLTAIQRSLDGDPAPDAIVLLCVNALGLQRIAKRAVQAGVHVFFLNAPDDDLELVRLENSEVTVSVVCPDELETGRIQGRQFRRLVRPGGRVLYIHGHSRSETARDRSAGVQEALVGASLELQPLEAGWTREEALEAVGSRLRLCARANRCVDLIGCQNDMLALGRGEPLATRWRTSSSGPQLRAIPVTGCDGLPSFGQAMVTRVASCGRRSSCRAPLARRSRLRRACCAAACARRGSRCSSRRRFPPRSSWSLVRPEGCRPAAGTHSLRAPPRGRLRPRLVATATPAPR